MKFKRIGITDAIRSNIKFYTINGNIWDEKYHDFDFTEHKALQDGTHLQRWAVRCVKCGELTAPTSCSNCGGTKFYARVTGFECGGCRLNFNRWECESCKTDNPFVGAFGGTYSSCFIASAVYGSDYAPEVVVLREFRDQCLMTHAPGKTLVRLYNGISPPIAERIERSPILKRAAKWSIVLPLIAVANVSLSRYKPLRNGRSAVKENHLQPH